jgi:2-hydroxychromene-2-carboxylate isomerase
MLSEQSVGLDRTVEFFFAPGSRYCYLAASQICSLETDTGCRVDWRAVYGPDLRALGGRDPFAGPPVSGQ